MRNTLVKVGFTLLEKDVRALDALRAQCRKYGIDEPNRSQLIGALTLLGTRLSDEELLALLQERPSLISKETVRPNTVSM